MRKGNEGYELLLEIAPEAIICIDERRRVLVWNSAAERLLGYPCNEALGVDLVSLIIPKEHTASFENQLAALPLVENPGSPHAPTVIEIQLRRSCGARFLAEISLSIGRLATEKLNGADGTTVTTMVMRDVTERKRAEETLRASREELRQRVEEVETLMEVVPAAIWVSYDPRCDHIVGNRAANAFYEASDGENVSANVSPARRFLKNGRELEPGELPMQEAAAKNADVRNAEVEVLLPSGKELSLLGSARPLRSEDGRVRGCVATFLDITERKWMEEELRRSRDELEMRVRERTDQLQLYKDLLELSHEAILIKDADHRITFWNQGAEEQYGWTEKEALGQITQELLHIRYPTPLAEITADLLNRGRWEGELQHTTKDGRELTVASRWALRRDKGGRPVAILQINNNITERKRLENALRSMNAYHRGLIEANLDPLVTIDAEGKISDANVATEHVTGYSRSQLVGTDFCDYFTDREKAREGYRHAFAFGTVRDYALEIRHRDGRVTPVLYNASVYRDDAGNVAGVFAAARDMAEVRRAEEQLRQAHKMEAVGTLAGGIAHDFNNMLAVIIGNAELALDDVEDDGPRQNLRQILNASKRSRDLVKQILAFSRSKTGGETTVKIVPLLKETYELLRASLPSTIRMKLNVRTKVDTAVVGDASKLQQVVINLANNAAHAMRETGGALTIGLSSVTLGPKSFPEGRVRPGSYVKLTMEDTGRGMTPEVRRRAFEPFFTTMEPGQGTGMGLSVVYGIVKGYNGTIEVKSEPGRGSTFTVLLPRSDALSPEEEQGEEETFHPSGNPHVLFVDDEPAVVEMTKIMLERMGYRVTAFTSSSEALKAFTRNPERFDLIITDQTMPDTTGVSLAKEILAVRQDMPIILCTGYSETVSPETAKKAGIRQFVMKPITKKEMAQAIHRALDEGEEE